MSNSNPDNPKIERYLPILIPAAVLMLLIKQGLLAVGLSGGIGHWRFWRYQQRQEQDKLAYLDEIFYQLVQENQGQVTPLDLAMKSRLSGSEVQQYLEQKAIEFSAQFEITEEGAIIYRFQTAQALKPGGKKTKTRTERMAKPALTPIPPKVPQDIKLFPIPRSSENRPSLPPCLNQSELAKRLQVHPKTLSRWKTRPQFQQWSAEKDPDNIEWNYSPETRNFLPVVSSESRFNWKKLFGVDD
ncbi:MAG: hypothetical protein ACFBSC_12295 [Microcoleaceae cyanobacterium]